MLQVMPSDETELQSKLIKNITGDIPELQLWNYGYIDRQKLCYSICLNTTVCKGHMGRI